MVNTSVRSRSVVVFPLLLLAALITGCPGDDTVTNPGEAGVSVTIAASGLSDGKLALNARASFTASVSGYDGDASGLAYRWALVTGRGELTDGTNALPNPTVGGATMLCLGETGGVEQIVVGVIDVSDSLLAAATYDFTIVPPGDPGGSRGCFDGPKIVFKYGASGYVCNFDGSARTSLGVSGGLSVVVSPDGEWIGHNDDSINGWDMYVRRCDGSDRAMIAGGTSEDFLPQFSPDSKTLYFLRPEPSQDKPVNAVRPLDIAAYDLESGQTRFVTTIHLLDEYVGDLTVSPVTGEIAFFRQFSRDLPEGGYEVISRLSIVDPAGGAIRDLVALPPGTYDWGLDWSPDGGDIIFSANIEGQKGIFRVDVAAGSQPTLVFADPSIDSVPPLYPHYYAGGDRIVWGGQENGQNNINLWSIDANGGDMQQVTDTPGPEFMQGVLH